MRILATLLPTLALAASLACAKPPGPDVDTPPGEGAGDPQPAACDFTADPNRNYVGQSTEQCATLRFVCEEGQEYFADECGCGCVTIDE
jgi:hypothetical protein